jgi:hypothetical protein
MGACKMGLDENIKHGVFLRRYFFLGWQPCIIHQLMAENLGKFIAEMVG